MKYFSDKLRLIFIPFLIITILFVVVYTFLHWLIVLQGEIKIKEDLIKFWLPFTLPFVVTYFWLYPRIKILRFKNENGHFFYLFMACMAIACPTIIAQEYLITATGKLTQLKKVSDFAKTNHTKYYTLKNSFIDKTHAAFENTTTVSGKNNEYLNLFVYGVLPLLDDASDTFKQGRVYWIGKKYSERISNHLSDEQKQAKFEEFAEKAQHEFDTTDFSKFTYLEVVGYNDDYDEYKNALRKRSPGYEDKSIVFEEHTQPFSARSGSKLNWFLGTLVGGQLLYIILLFFPGVYKGVLNTQKTRASFKNSGIRSDFDFLVPTKDFFVTPILILVITGIYITMVFCGFGVVSFKAHDLIILGANYGPLTLHGQWWRLLTSVFLHGGLMHILLNMYGLLFIGLFLEPILGRVKYVIVFFLTGVFASFTSVLWHSATVSIGASGAIFGLYGFFFACLLLNVLSSDTSKGLLISTGLFIGINLIMGLLGGIDNAAHIGGLLSGFVLGTLMSSRLKSDQQEDSYVQQN